MPSAPRELPVRALSWLALLLIPWAAAAQSPSGEADPRIALVEQQLARNHQEALRGVERALARDPAAARQLGLDYLRGHLLLLLDRRQEALQAFANSMGSTPELGAYSRYRLAVEQEGLGHPEVAAGLIATLLGGDPPRPLVNPAVRLLERTIAAGGDCRLLRRLDPLHWGTEAQRRLALARAECLARGGDAAAAEEAFLRLLEEDRGDDVAQAAARAIVGRHGGELPARTHLLVGMAFYNHREFHDAIHHLARALVQSSAADDVSRRESFECRYALARSHFWLGRYEVAATAFGSLAATAQSPESIAQSLYQRARSFELLDRWDKACADFQLAYQADPKGPWADAALISFLRLKWRRGAEEEAFAAYETLVAQRQLSTAARALLFFASSDLVQGRGDRAEAWLASADQLDKAPEQELAYWRGRLAEVRRRPERAAAEYAAALGQNPYHPFGSAAAERLRAPSLVPAARALGNRLAASARPDDLYTAWLLLGDGDPLGRATRRELAARLAADRTAAAFMRLGARPAASWPLWRSSLSRPEEMLLALGIFAEAAPVMLRHFPAADPALAFTGSKVLAEAGETHRSLYIAEILARRIPQQLPPPLLPDAYRQLLFPFSYSFLILRESRKRGVEPYLLAAIIREESRFDPHAFSSASARGLTQFIFPTASRLAQKIGFAPLAPRDLERPEVAIALGAAYLEELLSELDGDAYEAVAAYNAGEPQADLWRRYCFSDEPEEYLSKVAFRQTRAYLVKVLTSRQHYRELYGGASAPTSPTPSPPP